MPANNFSIGKDLSFALISPNGTAIDVTNVTSYKAARNITDLSSKGIDGVTRHANIPDSWTITISLDRKNPTLDRFFAQLDADYYAGINIRAGTVLETIRESDGSVTQFRYEECVFKYDGPGEFKGDSFVSTSLTIMASRQVLVA